MSRASCAVMPRSGIAVAGRTACGEVSQRDHVRRRVRQAAGDVLARRHRGERRADVHGGADDAGNHVAGGARVLQHGHFAARRVARAAAVVGRALAGRARHGRVQASIRLRVQPRQAVEERDDRPQLGVVEPEAPGGHAGHLQAVLRDPVELGGTPLLRRLRQRGRQRQQPLRELGRRPSRGAMALRAVGLEAAKPALDHRLGSELGHDHVARAALHRRAQAGFQQPESRANVLLGRRDVVQAAVERHACRGDSGGRGDREQPERGALPHAPRASCRASSAYPRSRSMACARWAGVSVRSSSSMNCTKRAWYSRRAACRSASHATKNARSRFGFGSVRRAVVLVEERDQLPLLAPLQLVRQAGMVGRRQHEAPHDLVLRGGDRAGPFLQALHDRPRPGALALRRVAGEELARRPCARSPRTGARARRRFRRRACRGTARPRAPRHRGARRSARAGSGSPIRRRRASVRAARCPLRPGTARRSAAARSGDARRGSDGSTRSRPSIAGLPD